MNELYELWEKPLAKEIYMLAGWHQWADAGSISSGLPYYLIDHMDARKLGEIRSNGYYLFQIPGTHHLLRPDIKFDEGFREHLRPRQNEIFYTGNSEKGLIIFIGEEPHLNEDLYAKAFFDMAEELKVKRIGIVGGVYGSMPYDKDREVSCAYSLRKMKMELTKYAARFSNYEGGATIGSYFVDRAERRDVELFVFNAFVPAYDFTQANGYPQGLSIEEDYKAWYDLMRRFNHMFDLRIDLSDLENKGDELIESVEEKMDEIERDMPQLKVREYMKQVIEEFNENPFLPLDDMWERELGDLFDD